MLTACWITAKPNKDEEKYVTQLFEITAPTMYLTKFLPRSFLEATGEVWLAGVVENEYLAFEDDTPEASATKIGFSKKYDLPDYEEFTELHDFGNWDEYDEAKVMKGYEQEETISKLLGYADLIQGGMLLECELVTNGIYCGDTPDITPEELKKFKENCDEWQLLFQLDTVTTNDFELMFGDCGRIYYYIKKEDLKKCKFDDCWLILQCG